MKEIMTKSEYAKHRGISRAMVSKYVRNGTIVLTSDKEKVMAELSDAFIDNYTDSGLRNQKCSGQRELPVSPPPLPPPETTLPSLPSLPTTTLPAIFEGFEDTYLRARADLTRAKANQAEYEYEILKGQHVPCESVSLQGFDCARATRDTIMQIPDRISAVLAEETRVIEIKRILKEELTKALELIITILERGES